MKRTTLTALRGSIKKWENIVDGTSVDRAAKNCPLCKLFIKKDCVGCPVFDRVGKKDCVGTPWQNWAFSFWSDLPWKATSPERKRLARAELKFLRSLLPKKKIKTKSK